MKRLALSSLAVQISALLGASLPGAIRAQDAAAPALEEITVTGSRIVRRDFEANSPILTVEEDAFDNTMSVGLETVMNQMPQFVPAVTPFTTTDVQASATNTPGASTLSLRGLGANRNLVLIDGRRGMPVNALGAISINSIPSAAVARVETITGGASSVYGADAMAGVVNFILKKDYEGVDFDVRYGETMEGDGEEMRVSGRVRRELRRRRGQRAHGLRVLVARRSAGRAIAIGSARSGRIGRSVPTFSRRPKRRT